MKFAAAALIVASASAQCECLTSADLPEASYFTEQGYPENYGTECDTWDIESASCLETYDVEWCSENWCYVADDCESALSVEENGKTLYYSTELCLEDSSYALYASAMVATIAVVAASL